jgi:DNA-binding FadR family transcriptional regulator
MDRPIRIARRRPGDSEPWIRVPKAAELVAAELRHSIVEGALKEGDTLPPEAELLRRFGVSRPTLREAYRLLESEGLITVQRGLKGGALVHAPNEDVVARHLGTILRFRGATLQDVYDARMLVEPPAAGLLARTRSPEVLDEIERILAAESETLRDSMAFSHEATHFHEKMLELAGNHTLAVFGKILSGIVEFHLHEANVREMLPKGDEVTGRAHRAHERLVELIRKGDAASAETFWRSHLEAAEHFLLPGEISHKPINLFR